jgi:hypothetical protein
MSWNIFYKIENSFSRSIFFRLFKPPFWGNQIFKKNPKIIWSQIKNDLMKLFLGIGCKIKRNYWLWWISTFVQILDRFLENIMYPNSFGSLILCSKTIGQRRKLKISLVDTTDDFSSKELTCPRKTYKIERTCSFEYRPLKVISFLKKYWVMLQKTYE